MGAGKNDNSTDIQTLNMAAAKLTMFVFTQVSGLSEWSEECHLWWWWRRRLTVANPSGLQHSHPQKAVDMDDDEEEDDKHNKNNNKTITNETGELGP